MYYFTRGMRKINTVYRLMPIVSALTDFIDGDNDRSNDDDYCY